MNEWRIYISLYCALCTPKRFTIMWVGGLSSTTTSVQHPLGWYDGCHRTAAQVCSPHTRYRWRGERVIEPIQWMGILGFYMGMYGIPYILHTSLLELTVVLWGLGKLWKFANQAGGLLVVGSQREDALIGGVGLLLAGHWRRAVVVVIGEGLTLYWQTSS